MALEGEESVGIFTWLLKNHPEEVEGVEDQDHYIRNNILDIYHSQGNTLLFRQFPRSPENRSGRDLG